MQATVDPSYRAAGQLSASCEMIKGIIDPMTCSSACFASTISLRPLDLALKDSLRDDRRDMSHEIVLHCDASFPASDQASLLSREAQATYFETKD